MRGYIVYRRYSIILSSHLFSNKNEIYKYTVNHTKYAYSIFNHKLYTFIKKKYIPKRILSIVQFFLWDFT